MVEIGRYNDLKITRKLDFGVIVDGGGYGEILVPRKYVLPEWHVGDTVTVFVYTLPTLFFTRQRNRLQRSAHFWNAGC